MNKLVMLVLTGLSVLIGSFFGSCTNELQTTGFDRKEERTTQVEAVTINTKIEKPIEQVDFVTSKVGWGLQNGSVVLTTDGGRTWDLKAAASRVPTDFAHVDIKDEFTRVVALTPSSALAVQGGSIVRTTDGGNSWAKTELVDVVVRDLSFVDVNHGWLVGEKRPTSKSDWLSCLYVTNDAGQSWTEVNLVQDSRKGIGTWWDVWGDTNDLWLVGDAILRSSDGGKSWDEVSVCDDVSGTPSEVGFLDELHGWLRTDQGSRFCITSDGGLSWETREFPEGLRGVKGLIQVDVHVFWVVGANGAFVTRDGGYTWEMIVDGNFSTGQYLGEENQLIFAGDRVVSIRLPLSK